MILTHQHIDHLGLVSLVAAHSGAEVAAIDVAVPFVENFSAEAQADDDFARETMLRHGIPEDVVSALSSVSRAFRAWGSRADVTRVLRDGDEMSFRDRTLQVHHRPGHSPTDTVFYDRERAHPDRRPTTCSATSRRTRSSPARRRARASARRRSSPTSTRCAPRARWTWSWCSPGTATRSRTTALIDDRFALHAPARGQDRAPAGRAPADRLRGRAGALGQHRCDAGLPDAVGGPRTHGPAAERRARPRAPGCLASGIRRVSPAIFGRPGAAMSLKKLDPPR